MEYWRVRYFLGVVGVYVYVYVVIFVFGFFVRGFFCWLVDWFIILILFEFMGVFFDFLRFDNCFGVSGWII